MATAFVAVPSLMFGAIEVLVPLRIDDLDGGHAVIAGSFIVGAGIEAALAPISGRYSDRVGRRTPFVTGLGIAALGMLGIAAAQAVGVVVAGLLIASLGAGLCFAPALTMLAETTESVPAAGGPRGRPLEHGLGERPGDRRDRRRRRRRVSPATRRRPSPSPPCCSSPPPTRCARSCPGVAGRRGSAAGLQIGAI